MTENIPVVLCGKSSHIATGVKNGLMPEYEVIHVILSPAAGIVEIPPLLRGETPLITDTENIGTRCYTQKPTAIILGAGYEDEHVAEMREACKGLSNVPWLRPDLSTPAPPLGPEYGKAMVQRVKACMKGLVEKEGGGNVDRVVYY